MRVRMTDGSAVEVTLEDGKGNVGIIHARYLSTLNGRTVATGTAFALYVEHATHGTIASLVAPDDVESVLDLVAM